MLKLARLAVLVFCGSTSWACAADLPIPARTVAATPMLAPAPAAHAWDGAYMGASAGFSTASLVAPSIAGFDLSGGLLSGQLGYNFSRSGSVFGPGNDIVLGLEGNLDWRHQLGNGRGPGYLDGDILFWSGALTGHLGLARDNWMGYLLAGVALASNEFDFQTTAPVRPTILEHGTHVGVTIGAGAALMIADNISVFAEYRYADYGPQDYSAAAGLHLTDNVLRIGANFFF